MRPYAKTRQASDAPHLDQHICIYYSRCVSIMKNDDRKARTKNLRQKAEELWEKEPQETGTNLSEVETLKLIHELEVHQIELEMQNEELMLARSAADVAAKKYTELYDFAPSGYFTLSREGIIIELNFSGSQVLGTERSRLKNKPFALHLSDDSRQIFHQFLEKAFSTNVKESCEVTLAAGKHLPVYLYLTGVATENDDQCLVTAVDITQRKQMEQELVKAKEKAEESDRLKSAFLANVSHEIRTPMNGIMGFTRLLKESAMAEEEQQEYIHLIEKSGARMLTIINSIMSISKIEAGEVEILLSDTNIKQEIVDIETFFQPEARQKGIQILIDHSLTDKPITIKTDSEKFYAILTNLVKNAIKFTSKGSVEIGCEKKRGYLKFFVRDTGIGILPDQLEMIFERFRQASESLTRKYEGTGLGLSISKAYVEMLGGKIWVESELGKGSTFYFTLPYHDDEQKGTTNKKLGSGKTENNQIRDLKVVIAEDDAISGIILGKIIRKYCKEILQAKDGVEAVELCRNNPDIDLIFMDIQMPNMDGYEATREIRKFNKDVVIIAQTAFALSSERKKVLGAGCNDYLSKPFKLPTLFDLMKKHFTTGVDD